MLYFLRYFDIITGKAYLRRGVLMLGLDTKKVILVEHDEDWANQFQITKKEIENILGDNVIEIYHIGSTAIKGIMAKPIIDIAVKLKSFDQLNVEGMEAAGYEYGTNMFVPGEHSFYKYADESRNIGTHHIHCNLENSEDIKNVTMFCDYLNAHPETAKQYNNLKLKLAAVYAHDRRAYTRSKTDFINKIVSMAEDELRIK